MNNIREDKLENFGYYLFFVLWICLSLYGLTGCFSTKQLSYTTIDPTYYYNHIAAVIDSGGEPSYNEELYRFDGDKIEKLENPPIETLNNIYLLSSKDRYTDEGLNKLNGTKLLQTARTKDNVQVNLTLANNKEVSLYTTAKLTVDVNCATDLEIFIPCPVKDIFADDDLNYCFIHRTPCYEYEMISLSRMEARDTGFGFYSLKNTLPYDIIIKYVDDGENSGIRINTFGITQQTLNLIRNYTKSISFEVYNFFELYVKPEQLKEYFNKSTIKFVNNKPTYYLNVIMDFDEDCKVLPVGN